MKFIGPEVPHCPREPLYGIHAVNTVPEITVLEGFPGVYKDHVYPSMRWETTLLPGGRRPNAGRRAEIRGHDGRFGRNGRSGSAEEQRTTVDHGKPTPVSVAIRSRIFK